MPYFTIGKIFLFPSYDLSVEEKNIFDIYLSILEDSGVGAIIENATKKNTMQADIHIIHIDYLQLSFTVSQNTLEVLGKLKKASNTILDLCI